LQWRRRLGRLQNGFSVQKSGCGIASGACAIELEHNRNAVMPIRAYLDGHKFDGELIRLMGIAFKMALGSFCATPAHDDPIRSTLAHRIIAQAQAGERNPERLCDAALNAVGPPDPLLNSRTMNRALIHIKVHLQSPSPASRRIDYPAGEKRPNSEPNSAVHPSICRPDRAGAGSWLNPLTPFGDNQGYYSVLEEGVVVGRIVFLDAVGSQDRPGKRA
jgi:hypothetical protein